MSNEQSSTSVDAGYLRESIKEKYRDVALDPGAKYHFHTGRRLAIALGYPDDVIDGMPESAIESFAGVGNPFSLRPLRQGEKVVDLGSGAGYDCFVSARAVGSEGLVIGVDMTAEMLDKSRNSARAMHLTNVEFREGLLEALPVDDNWADVVISNGVINLCADKKAAFQQIWRVLRPGGHVQFADIANGQPVPEAATRNVDLWTA